MKFEMYERQARDDYVRLSETVATILTAAVQAQPSLRVQQVQHRAKDPASLKKKLEKTGDLESENIENVVKDLAGCRLVFYTNSDISRFLSSGIVRENFDVDWDRTKIHHPSPDTSSAADLFISNNYVVRLNDQRVALPEYARFREMWCEVQVQTTLNHAWSEMAHDTIYKKPVLKGFGGSLMQGIEKRMETIMRNFLLPAGYEFQKVLNDFERLSSGKDLFEQGALNALVECNDNNARHDLLQRFATYVLPHYDDLRSVQSDIRSAVVTAVKQSRETSTRFIETPFGTLPGHTVEQIVSIVADILDHLRYLDEEAVEATFDAISDLFLGAISDEERKRLLQSAKDLSKHKLDVWKEAGPLVQRLLIERIRRLDVDALALIKPVAMEVLGQVLRPEIGGTSSTYNTVTFHTGAVLPSEILTDIRSRAIEVLETFFRDAKTDAERRAVVRLLSNATTTPHIGNYSNALLKTVLDDTGRIVKFYIEVAGTQSYELLQEIEHDLLWFYRRNRDMPGGTAADSEIATARQRLTQDILNFRDLVNRDRSFNVYKILVGYQSVFPPAWEGDKFDLEGEKAYRSQMIGELVNEVTEENADEWLAVLTRCAQTESSDLATFPSFGRFLEELGRSKPQILITYLDRLDDRLSNFLPAMLNGLEGGETGDVVNEKVRHWVDRRQYLRQIIWHQRFATKFDAALLEQALKAAIEAGDDIAVLNAVSTSAARHGDIQGGLIEGVFLPAIECFTAKGDTRWVNAVWPHSVKISLFQGLTSVQAGLVLASLIRHPQIDHRVEDVLDSIAASWPELVVDFFGSRLKVEPTLNDTENYEAIPFQFDSLHVPLGKIPDFIVEKARTWFDEDKHLFTYRGGRLLSNVFPNFSPEFDHSLQNLAESREKSDLEFIVMILRNYHGERFTHDLCKFIVEILPANDSLLNEIEAALDATGVVSGEFGFVEAYKRKKAEIEPWLSDPRESVQSFAIRYILSLDRQISAEQRRGEENLEMRKREYGEIDGSSVVASR